jgi:YfiH family protein
MLANKEGTEVAVAHAGWRGLQAGILKNTIAKMTSDPNDIMAWMGPAIGPCHYEVGIEVKESFRASAATQEELNLVERSFAESDLEGKFYMNLYLIARRQLLALGVSSVSGGDHCTYCEENKFYSYRRDGKTGRMASIIFFQEEAV